MQVRYEAGALKRALQARDLRFVAESGARKARECAALRLARNYVARLFCIRSIEDGGRKTRIATVGRFRGAGVANRSRLS